jgi:Linalool dehydratase/isomerase
VTATTAPEQQRRIGANGVLLLPDRPPRLGPVSRKLVLRLLVVLAVVVIAGTAMVAFSDSAAVRAAGLSLVFPGGGFLFIASPLLFVVAMVALVLAVVLWWGISAHWAIPLVWLLSAVGAAALADGPRLFVDRGTTWPAAIPVVYALAAVAVGTAVFRLERKYRRKLAKVPELNAYLGAATVAPPEATFEEPTDFDAELLGWVYDMALQPLDEFTGFDWGEQIHGPTCVRYQLNMLGYGLALYAANHLPNAPQPIEAALANLIVKATDLRVWKYWRTLNLIGNFDANPDPIVRDNIMISAYLAEQVNLYEAATGSTRFDEPGSLTFVWKDGRTFPYDHHSIVEAVRRNFEANELGFFPCEPGWVFTACNTMGAQALKGHDALHATEHWPAVEPKWRHAVEVEMLTPDGNLPHIRSKLVGLSFDTGEVPGGEYFLTGTNGFADVAPDLAVRGGLLALRGADAKMAALRGAIVDGELQLDMEPAPERNTLITTAVPQWTRLFGGARAVGEVDVARAGLRRMEATCGTGRRWPERPLHAGVQTLGIHLLTRWGAPLSSAALALRGHVAPTGPILADGPWDDVLVTTARCDDGVTLELVLRPHRDGSLPVTLGFEALMPQRHYRLVLPDDAVVVTADGMGQASATFTVAGRVHARLRPVDSEPSAAGAP